MATREETIDQMKREFEKEFEMSIRRTMDDVMVKRDEFVNQLEVATYISSRFCASTAAIMMDLFLKEIDERCS